MTGIRKKFSTVATAAVLVGLAMLVSPASAQRQDLTPSGATPAGPGPSCYGSLFGGPGVSVVKTDLAFSATTRGFQGGVGLGCDIQISQVIVGGFARYELTSADGTIAGLKIDAKPSWTIGGRAGVAINPSVLGYGLLGYSGTEFRIEDAGRSRHSGVVYGAGVEMALANTPVWLTLEYTRTDWRSRDFDGVKITPSSDAIRAGLVYKFIPR